MDRNARLDRAAVLGVVALFAINLATTARWAAVPGGMRGWRWPLVVAALLCAALTELRRRASPVPPPRWLPGLLLGGGIALLVTLFFGEWLPLSTWTRIPFVDDWPPRFSSTVEGLELLKRGTLAGWQWNLLGGYATATDVTQNLTVVGALPMLIFGDVVGFHLLHLLLFLAVPCLVFVDLRKSGVAAIAAGLVALSACTFSWGIIRAGDSNSLAGVVGVLAVLAASRRARAARPYGFAVLVLALTLTAYSHLGFFAYAVVLLGVESVYYADRRQFVRALAAIACAVVASLPETFELIRYRSQFNFNNVMYTPPTLADVPGALRRVGYNVEILFSPHRWFGDTSRLFLPILLLTAWRREGRAGFYACAAVCVVGLTLLNVPEAGYVFQRPAHLLVAFTPIAIAAYASTRAASRLQAGSLVALAVLSMPIATGFAVPHQPSVDAFVPRLVERVRAAEGEMVLLENNPHRETAVPPQHSEKSLYGTHYESLMPAATGKRLYAGYWDGWQFTPFRGEMLAGGAWQGHLLTDTDRPAFLAELRRWGIRRLFVWTNTSKAVLAQWPELAPRWSDGPWQEFEFVDPDPVAGSVVTSSGTGDLVARDLFGGVVRLTGVRTGDRVIVRTHHHPAWQASGPSGPIALADSGGQLGFLAPADGSYDVRLIYPSRSWLWWLAIGVLLLAFVVDRRMRA